MDILPQKCFEISDNFYCKNAKCIMQWKMAFSLKSADEGESRPSPLRQQNLCILFNKKIAKILILLSFPAEGGGGGAGAV